MRTTLAFLRRDGLIWMSYRLALVSQLLSVTAMIGMIYFIGRTVQGNHEVLEKYGGDYVAFLLSGLALTDLFTRGLGTLPGAIRQNQQNGTLEPMLAAPVRLFDLILSSSLFGLLVSVFRVTLLIVFGVVVMGFWRQANVLSFMLVLVPGALSIFALAILFAALVIAIKQADPIVSAYGIMAAILGGMVFPVEALPDWVRPLSWVVPLSHALTGLRLALLGEPPSGVLPQAAALCVLALVLLPVSVLAFNWSVNRAKHDGSLVQY